MGSIAPGFNTVLKINHTVRSLILDYALAAAILGLIATIGQWLGLYSFLALTLLNLKMMRDIGVRWGRPKGQDAFAIFSSLVSVLGAFAIAIMVRLLFSVIGLFIPLIIVFNRAVGYATLTWALGRATNQFYLSSKRVDSTTLKQMLQIHRNLQKKQSSKKQSVN